MESASSEVRKLLSPRREKAAGWLVGWSGGISPALCIYRLQDRKVIQGDGCDCWCQYNKEKKKRKKVAARYAGQSEAGAGRVRVRGGLAQGHVVDLVWWLSR